MSLDTFCVDAILKDQPGNQTNLLVCVLFTLAYVSHSDPRLAVYLM